MSKSSQNLWDFSIQLYQDSKIQSHCLSLQDSHGLDVPLLLWCCWHGVTFGCLTDTQLRLGMEFSTQWRHQVVGRLRETRRWMKAQQASGLQQENYTKLRESIKSVELVAEKYQLEHLEQLSNNEETNNLDDKAAHNNICAMLAYLQIPQSQEMLEHISFIGAAANRQ